MGVGDFQAIQAYEKFTPPRKWVFKKITPPVYVTGPKCNPPTPTPSPSPQDATCLRLGNCVQHVFWPVADKPKSIARSFVIVQYGSSKEGKRICGAGVNVGPEKIRFKREVIARIEPRGCTSETGDKNYKQCYY